jgi:lysophospholipase L1-like esterase
MAKAGDPVRGRRVKRAWLGLAACLALTCARPGRPELARAAPAAKKSAPAKSPPAATPAASPAPVARPVAAAPGPLTAFFDALRELEAGTLREHVRVLWLGDSHTNADFLTGSVRGALSARFGDGGPGFVRIGTRPYRHDGVKVVRDGNWNVDPDPPARRALQDDGVFGLAGTRAVPGAGASFSLEVSAKTPRSDETASFELSYSLPAGSSFDVELAGQRSTIAAHSSRDVTTQGIAHLTLSAPLRSRLVITPHRGAPRLFGLNLERQAEFGLVLDTAGIDGARIETPLAWDEGAFTAEVARRSPRLFVIAYGTNEAFDQLKVERYGPQLGQLVQRLRRGAPGASCLVLGPTDAPLGDASVPRVGEVTQVLQQAALGLGCAFVSLQQLMGGEGSFARGMKAKERLAQPDKLHLTPKGYQELGQALAQQLLAAYSAGRGALP